MMYEGSKVAYLDESVERKRNTFIELSEKLFRMNQEFVTKHEEFQNLETQIAESMEIYVDTMTKVALKEAEVDRKRETSEIKAMSNDEMLMKKSDEVDVEREKLKNSLELYRQCRKNVKLFESDVNKEADDARIDSLNYLAFTRYSQSVLQNEMKKIANKKTLPSRKEILEAKTYFTKEVNKSTLDLAVFYRSKILDFRRQERILVGRSRELMEQSGSRSAALYEEFNNLSTLDGRNNSMEKRFLQRLVSTTGNLGIDLSGQSEDAVDAFLAPKEFSENVKISSSLDDYLATSSMKPRGKNSPRNAVFEGSLENKTDSKKGANTELMSKKSMIDQEIKKLVEKRRVFDPRRYDVVTNPEAFHPHTLIDNKPATTVLAERGHELARIAVQLCNAEGKLKQLTAIKEGLDMQILNQAHLLLSFASDLQADFGTTILPVLNQRCFSDIKHVEHLLSGENNDNFNHRIGRQTTSDVGGALSTKYRCVLPYQGEIKMDMIEQDILSEERQTKFLFSSTAELMKVKTRNTGK